MATAPLPASVQAFAPDFARRLAIILAGLAALIARPGPPGRARRPSGPRPRPQRPLALAQPIFPKTTLTGRPDIQREGCTPSRPLPPAPAPSPPPPRSPNPPPPPAARAPAPPDRRSASSGMPRAPQARCRRALRVEPHRQSLDAVAAIIRLHHRRPAPVGRQRQHQDAAPRQPPRQHRQRRQLGHARHAPGRPQIDHQPRCRRTRPARARRRRHPPAPPAAAPPADRCGCSASMPCSRTPGGAGGPSGVWTCPRLPSRHATARVPPAAAAADDQRAAPHRRLMPPTPWERLSLSDTPDLPERQRPTCNGAAASPPAPRW